MAELMRFWLTHKGPVSVREQLVTQIMLGIVSGELPPGAKLPSTRELARRLKIHANTVSSAFGQLEEDGWLSSRRGSGVYVRERRGTVDVPAISRIDEHIAVVFRIARENGLPLSAVQERLQHWSKMRAPKRFLLVEPDEELAGIVVYELRRGLASAVTSCTPAECKGSKLLAESTPLVLPSKAARLRPLLPPGVEFFELHIRPAQQDLGKWLPAPADVLLGVASRWYDFLARARTMLLAAGFDESALVIRDARERNWQRGLTDTAAVICDSLTATKLPRACRAIPFPLVSENSLAELKKLESFVSA